MPDEIQPEPDAQAVQEITERLNEIGRRAASAKFWNRLGLLLMGAVNLKAACSIPILLICLFPLNLIVFTCLISALSHNAPTLDAGEIAQAGGVKAIPPLFAIFQKDVPMPQKQAICSALALLLPRLKFSDANLLTPHNRRTMQAWLAGDLEIGSSYTCPDALRLAALKALEQVGDTRDIPAVEQLTNLKPQTPEQAKIKQAAIECLPMLLANCGEVEAARTLLRASHAQDARPETLLRPASQAAQTNPAELLRGSEPPPSSADSGG